jgi:hypothetical protein
LAEPLSLDPVPPPKPAGPPPARRAGSPYPKAALLPRAVARASDLTLALLLSSFPGKAGVLAGLLYLLVADALWHGQSVGKKIAGIKVVHVPTRTSADIRHSMVRNAPFALAFLFTAISILGWLLFLLIGLPLILFEGYMVYTDSLGIRLGDIFADTQVIDAKVVAGAPLSSVPLQHHEAAH